MRPQTSTSGPATAPPRVVPGAPVEVRGHLQHPVSPRPTRQGPLRAAPAEPAVLAAVRVVSGPGAGDVVRLGPGRHPMGAAAALPPGPGVALEDQQLTGVAVWVVVGDDGSVAVEPDPSVRGARRAQPTRTRPLAGPLAGPDGSDQPGEAAQALVRLARARLRTRRPWHPGASLAVGDVLLDLTAPAPPAPEAAPGPHDVVRGPRRPDDPRPTHFVLPEPAQTPWGVAAAPRWSRRGREAARAHHHDVQAVLRRVRRALAAEPAGRSRDLPDATRVLDTLLTAGPRLWERRRSDPDWLFVRVGTADLPSEVLVLSADRRSVTHRWTAPDVPAAVDLDRAGVVGLSGPPAARTRLASWVLAQIAAAHSPSELRISMLLPEPASSAWSSDTPSSDTASGRTPDGDPWAWARRLPHVRAGQPVAGPREQGEPAALTELDRLTALLQVRRGQARGAAEPPTFDPVVVLADAATLLRPLPQTLALLKEGPAVGFRFLWLDDDPGLLPRECGVTIDLRPPLLQIRVAGTPSAELVRADLPSGAWCERFADALHGLREVTADDEIALPTQARLLSLLGLESPNAQQVLHRWVVGGGRTTTALLGEGADGPFSVDLRRDGPHALIAGAYGAGKSELLQTLIASLAVGNRPDELAFVLIDHGSPAGAQPFSDCARLPHTVGVVTDLDAHRTARVLESLGAEVRRRRAMLARAAVKDVDEYQAGRDAAMLSEGRAGRLPPEHPFAQRMPRLVLVIDEFAALAAELPDFLTGLVDVARVGRSRGIHLVLATERPAGVVSEDIAGAARLRIALRLDEAADSRDVVDAPDAARIPRSLPGRGFARLYDSPLFAFQAARVAGIAPGPHRGRAPRSDLALLVDAVRAAAKDAGIAAVPAPWLPPLPDALVLDDLPDKPLPGTPHPGKAAPRVIGAERRVRAGTVPPLRFGLADLPWTQHQDVAVFDIAAAGHLLVAGAPGSGRSTLLRALAASVARDTRPEDVRLVVVDPNARWSALAGLPHTDRVLAADGAAALAEDLLTEIARRRDVLARQHLASVAEQRARAATGESWPYLLVVVDRWEQALAAGPSGAQLSASWRRVLAEGPRSGVRVVLCGATAAPSLDGLVDDVLMLTGAADGPAAGLQDDRVDGVPAVPHDAPVGRAVRLTATPRVRGGQRPAPAHEVQVALVTRDPSMAAQDAALVVLGEQATRRYARQR